MDSAIRTDRYRLSMKQVILSCLMLLIACSAYGNPQDIDLTQPCDDTINYNYPIFMPQGASKNVDINAISAPAGNLGWAFDSIPFAYGGAAPCSGSNPVTCNNVTVTLPALAPGSTATVSGTANTDRGGFLMTLEAAVGVTGCTRQYTVMFIPPFQAVLVLDRSGSMGGTTNIDPPATNRWDALHQGVNNFVPFFVRAGKDLNSALGMTLFNNAVITNSVFSNTLETITDNPMFANNINSELSQLPSGSTGIGTALQNAIAKFTNSANPRSIVLFTDGEQNQAPHVELNGKYLNQKRPWEAGYLECTDAAHGHADCSEISTDINIVTIGIGQPSGDYLTTLQNLANTHNGNYIFTRTSDDFKYDGGGSVGTGSITDAFTLVISPTLQNNSPQMVASNKGQLSGSGTVTLPAFKVNKHVTGLLIQVAYSKKFERPDLVGLLAGIQIEKDGVNIMPYFEPKIIGNFTNSITLVSNFMAKGLPAISPEGEYTVTMAKPGNISDIGFRIASFADDHRLKMKWQVNPASPIVGQNFNPRMTLSWMGDAMDSATVEAFVLHPGGDDGDTLATYGGTIDPSSAPDAGTPGYQKYMYLLLNDPAFLEKLKANENKVTLIHQADGLYEASYSPDNISGIYQILYSVSYDSPETGKVQRLAAQSVYVRFGELDIPNSTIATSISGTTTTITMKPISSVGKLIGPGQQNAFNFTGSALTVANVTDHQDGSYTFVLEGDPNQDVDITLLGETVFQGKPVDFVSNQVQPLSPWKIILLILAVLVIVWIVIRIIKSRNNP